MKPKHNFSKLNDFYKNYEEVNPAYVLGLIIISLGIYIITWIYNVNKNLENLDDDAPEALRGALLMVILPFLWLFTTSFLELFIESIVLESIKLIVYVLLYFLFLNYLFDFCVAFSHITRSKPLIWFFPLFLGSLGIFGYYLQSIWVSLLLLILLLMIPAMQAELNKMFHKMTIKKNNVTFYS